MTCATTIVKPACRQLCRLMVLLAAGLCLAGPARAAAGPEGQIGWAGNRREAFQLRSHGDGRQWTVTPPLGSWDDLQPGLSALTGLGPAAARVTGVRVQGGERPQLLLDFAQPVEARLVSLPTGVALRWRAVSGGGDPAPPEAPRPLAAGVVADIVGGAGGASLMLAWLLKKLKGESTESSKTLEVIPVTETKALHVVERGAKILLIEVEGERSQVISQVSDPNLVAYLKSAKGSLKGSAFLAQYLKRAASGHALDETPAAVPKPEPAKAEPVAKAEPAAPKPAPEAPKAPAKPAVVADEPPARGGFDFTVDDSTPVRAPKPPKPPEPVHEPEVMPKADLKPVVARSEAANAIMQKLEKAMDRFADNTGDGLVQAGGEMLPSTIKISEPVTMALREVVDRQRQRLDTIKEVKQQEELEKARVEGLLRRKKEVEEKIGKIQEMLGRIDQDSGRNQPQVETSLLATSRDLQSLEDELSKIMTDPGVIRYLLAERDDFQSDSRNPLDSIVNSVRTIERQRKQIAAIRHTREQAEAERRRVVLLLIRKNELETAIDEIKQVIKQIEETNAEIIRMDPYAMPETVPIVAMNELRRLEFEMNTILADPSVAKKLAEAPGDMVGGGDFGGPSAMPQLPAM